MALTVLAGQILLADDLNKLVPLLVRKPADETVNNSTTLQNDDHMALSVAANMTYEFKMCVFHNSSTVADLKYDFTFPTGLTMKYGLDAAAAGGGIDNFVLIQTSVPVIGGVGADRAGFLSGTVITFTTAGTLQLRWAQNTAEVSDTKVLAGSYMRLTAVA